MADMGVDAMQSIQNRAKELIDAQMDEKLDDAA